jgi:hypothetical protein
MYNPTYNILVLHSTKEVVRRNIGQIKIEVFHHGQRVFRQGQGAFPQSGASLLKKQ